jgi:hypothetical protein
MPAYLLNIKRIDPGMLHSSGVIPKEITTEAQVNQEYARCPDNISVVMDVVSEAQARGILQYAKAIDNGTNTSSVETAISAII